MEIDVDELRDYMIDYCGTAAFSGSPAAVLDVVDIEKMDGYELCEKAEDLGINLRTFEVESTPTRGRPACRRSGRGGAQAGESDGTP